MARSKEYFINKLKNGYRVEMIFQQRDLDEMEAVVIQDHIREGHQLSEKEDYGTLREVLRMFMAENIDRKQRENGPVITTVTQAIEAIDPKLAPTMHSIDNFAATIGEEFLTPENIGSKIPGVVAASICRVYEKEMELKGTPVPENEKFNKERFERSAAGSALSSIFSLIAKNSANDIKERLFDVK